MQTCGESVAPAVQLDICTSSTSSELSNVDSASTFCFNCVSFAKEQFRSNNIKSIIRSCIGVVRTAV